LPIETRPDGWKAVAVALAIGLVWLTVELGHGLVENRALDVADALWRFAAALPWQLALFALFGLPISLLPDRLRPGWRGAGFATLALATLVFLGARVGEGGVRREQISALGAIGQIAAVAGGAVALAALFAWIARRLPARAGRVWTWASWTVWSLLFVPALDRAAPTLALGRLPYANQLFDAPELGFAAAATLCAAVIALRPRVWPLALLLLLPLQGRVRCQAEPVAQAASERPDVLVILLDTLRADHLGRREGRPVLAPALEAVFDEGIRFSRAYAPANRTLTSMPGIMTSLSVQTVGRRLSPEARTLAEHLRDAGWATYGISANPLVSARLGYDQGFEWFSDSHDWTSFRVGDLRRIAGVLAPGFAYHRGVATSEFYYRPVSEIRRRASRVLRDAKRPSFVYLHTMDMHGPYLPPRRLLPADYRAEDFLSYFSFLRLGPEGALVGPEHEAGIANLRQRYAAQLRFTDEELGRLFDELRASGRWDETLVWILSDHGESFGEGGFAGHGGSNATPSVLQVPLGLKPPRSAGIVPRVVATPVSTYDVVPTTLGLLGLPPPRPSLGLDLSGLVRGEDFAAVERAVVSQADIPGGRILSCVRGPWKLDVQLDRDGRLEVLSLHRLEIDPDARIDLQKAYPDVRSALETEVRRYLEQERLAFFRRYEPRLDERTREQLRRLGYVE
jgi:arylsulfatase